MNIAERLQELRKQANYSQEQVAEKLNISRQAISKWESGQGNPEIENIIKLTELYHVSADYILLGNGVTKEIKPESIKRKWSRATRISVGVIAIIFSTAMATVLLIYALSILR